MTVTLGLAAVAFSTASLDAWGQLTLSESMGTLALVAANVNVMLVNRPQLG